MNGYNFAEARKQRGLTQEELASLMGTSQTQIYFYESGKRDPKGEFIIRLAKTLGVSLAYLLGVESEDFERHEHLAPVMSNLKKNSEYECLDADKYQEVRDTLYEKHPRAFWLEVKGNSMNRLFPDGSLVLVDPDTKVQNGDVCAIHMKDHEAILKRIFFENDGVLLCPESYDDEYPTVFVSDISDERRKLIIIGKVISYTAPDGWRA